MHKRSLALSLITYLGNKSPSEQQIKVIEAILLSSWVKTEVLFDSSLTQRESECLYLACCGHNANETGAILKISKKTVDSYRSQIKKKLGCRNLIQAATQGIKYGYIKPLEHRMQPSTNTGAHRS